jgi:hypothetical protein
MNLQKEIELELARVEGAVDERKRIIKLLDEAFIYGTPVVIQREQLIALIKGENNA